MQLGKNNVAFFFFLFCTKRFSFVRYPSTSRFLKIVTNLHSEIGSCTPFLLMMKQICWCKLRTLTKFCNIKLLWADFSKRPICSQTPYIFLNALHVLFHQLNLMEIDQQLLNLLGKEEKKCINGWKFMLI